MKIKRNIFALLAALLLVLGACATSNEAANDNDTPLEEATTDPQADPQGIHGMISRIEHGSNVAYIFGSMHAGRSEWYPLSPVVEDAMRRADAFVFEYDMSFDENDLDIMLMMMEHVFLPDGMTLQHLLPEDLYEIFLQNVATFDWLDYETARTMHPMAIATTVTYEILSELDISMEYSIDNYVFQFAEEHGMPVYGLNDIASEMSIVFEMPPDVMIAVMAGFQDKASTLEDGEELRLANAYEINDLQTIRDIFDESFELADEDLSIRFMRDMMMHKRCMIFADEIERLLLETNEPTTFFITVGLGHIIGGEAGQVFYILRDRGFEVVGLYN